MRISPAGLAVALVAAAACTELPAAPDVSGDVTIELPAPPGIPRGTTWRATTLPTGIERWKDLDFDDHEWVDRAAPVGFGEAYLGSIVAPGFDATMRARRIFTIDDPQAVTSLVAEVMYDDGVEVYLNGVRIVRASMTATGTTAYPHEAGQTYERFPIAFDPRAILRPGENVIAARVYQAPDSLDDLVFDLALEVEVAPPSASVARRAIWRYWAAGAPPAGWNTDADTTGWSAGDGPFVRHWDHATAVHAHGTHLPLPSGAPTPTTYWKRTIHVADPAAVTSIRGELFYDDGAVVYVNGHELARPGLPAGPIAHDTLAAERETTRYEVFDWTAAKPFLVAGENVIAVELHQATPGSDDLIFDLALQLDTAATPRVPGCLPATRPYEMSLGSVWMAPDGSAWAVGSESIIGRRDPLGRWTWCTLGGDVHHAAVWGSAADDVWIAGSHGSLVRWDGSTFTALPTGTTETFTDLWGSGPANVFAVGANGVIRRWDGTALHAADLDPGLDLSAVWGASPTDVLVGGRRGLPGEPYGNCNSELYRWNATTQGFAHAYTRHLSGGVACGILGIGGSGPDDVWAVGHSTPAGAGSTQSLALRWDGTAWQSATPPAFDGHTYGDVLVAGGGLWIPTGGRILRRVGTSWFQEAAATSGTLALDVLGTKVIAVGQYGRVIRWDGETWTKDD